MTYFFNLLSITFIDSIKVTSTSQYISASGATLSETYNLDNSVDIVTNIIENGLVAKPTSTSGVTSAIVPTGGNYGGGGGGGGFYITNGYQYAGAGGVGAVRIIWPGTTRSFPSTNTGDL